MNKLAGIIPAGPRRLAAALAPQSVDARTLFHPVAHALLRQFFKLRALRDAPADLTQPSSGAWIGIDPALADYGVSNAVARLCLGAIRQRLPQWGAASADGRSCADIAIGSFRGTDIRAGAGRVIRRDWRRDWTGVGQAPWAYLFDAGCVDEAEALAWRARVWRGCGDV